MSETKKRRHKKGHMTRKVQEIYQLKVIPHFPAVPPVQNSKRPGHDFYQFVNARWLKSVKTPSYRSAYGVSEELEEEIKLKLLILLEKGIDFAKKGQKPDSIYEKAFQQMGEFGLSALRPAVQIKSILLLKKMIYDINCIRNISEVSNMLGTFAKFRISSFLSFYTYYEAGSPIYGRVALAPGQLGLPDTSYYFPTEESKETPLSSYAQLLDKLSELLQFDEKLGPAAQLEVHFAKELLQSQFEKEELYSGKKLEKEFPTLDWNEFWKGVGYSDWKSYTIRVNPPGWLLAIDKALKDLPLETWKLLLKTHLLLHALPLLPPPYDEIHSAFFEKQLRGQARKLPQKELTIRLLQDWMPTTTSKLYLKYFVDKHLKKEATAFTKSIQAAAINRIQQTTWFTSKTREKAVEKVRKMKLGVAYPASLEPLTGIQLQTDNLLQNVLLLGTHHTTQEVGKANTKINIEKEWEEAIYAVNAYYYSEINQLILPAGSLLWPFYHPNAPPGWNYGGLGAVIGHEMTHAFDSDGKDYNWEGKKENWWTIQDNKEYTKKTKALIELFNQAKILDHPVNGALTLNENISDLGGLAIALDALKLDCDAKKVSETLRNEAYRNFFISYAVSWRIKEKPEKSIQGLFMDRHAPAQLRVNLIVSQFDEWYKAFDIQVNDTLYIPPEERIRIF